MVRECSYNERPLTARAVIFSNGTYANLMGVKARLRPDDWFVCADGALSQLAAMQLRPHLLVGDFDSVDLSLLAEAKEQGVELLTFQREKDFTDTELAWQEVIRRKWGWRDVLVVGAWGGRLDHSLANLLLFAPFAKQGYRISLTDGVTDAYLVTDELVLERCQNKLVSIIALSPSAQGVTAQGFHWPLEAATLRWGEALGISNIPVDDVARVRVKEGILLVIVTPED